MAKSRSRSSKSRRRLNRNKQGTASRGRLYINDSSRDDNSTDIIDSARIDFARKLIDFTDDTPLALNNVSSNLTLN